MTSLESVQTFPSTWLAPLSEFGYSTVEEFLSTCAVEGGREALASTVGASVEEVATVEAQLTVLLGAKAVDFTPAQHPMGAILDDVEPGDDCA